MQGLLELAGIPYVGAGVLGSAIGMDKDVQKRLLRDAGVAVVKYFSIDRADYQDTPALATKLARKLGYPVFVKPNALGSSIGISKVKRAARSQRRARRRVSIRSQGADRGVMRGPRVRMRGARQRSSRGVDCRRDRGHGGHEFYSYESKYVDPEGSATKIPAELPPAKAKSCARWRWRRSRRSRCAEWRGSIFSRAATCKEIYVNEVNTIPGFTSISMYPKLWEASGLPLPEAYRSADRAGAGGSSRARLAEDHLSAEVCAGRDEPMNRLLIATTNPAKLAEYRSAVARSASTSNWCPRRCRHHAKSPEETGETFDDNALIKARFYFERARYFRRSPTMAASRSMRWAARRASGRIDGSARVATIPTKRWWRKLFAG